MNEFEKACEADRSDGFSSHENVIEFLRNSKIATLTLSQPKYVNKIKKLKEQFPNEVEIVHENVDGSIVCHIPTSYIKINNPPRKQYTEEERAIMAERMRNVRENNRN